MCSIPSRILLTQTDIPIPRPGAALTTARLEIGDGNAYRDTGITLRAHGPVGDWSVTPEPLLQELVIFHTAYFLPGITQNQQFFLIG